jgi:diguanylate cyclase (GGDEF)-like protein
VAATLDARVRTVLLETSVREVPIAGLIFAGIIVLFDALTVASGIALPTDYLLSDVAQIAAFATVAVLVGRRITPTAAAPWLWAGALAVSGVVLNFQYTFDPAGAGIGILIMLLAVSGPLTLFWGPFLIQAAVVLAASAYTLFTYQPDYAVPWLITLLTVAGASAALLFARRRSALDVARAAAELEHIATRDPLTGLLNRHGLEEAGEVLRGLAVRADRPLFAMFIDVSGLKGVNDTHGHAAGDLVLQRTAEAARAASRGGDLVVRWGGDEFLIVGIGAEPDAAQIEERIAAAIDRTGLVGVWDGTVHIGAASSADWPIDELVEAADTEMYRRRDLTR